MFKLEKFYPEGFKPQQYWDDEHAGEYIAGKSSQEFRRQGFWPVLRQCLEKRGKYLDAGCGIGGWILFLREEGYDVEGIDSAARAVRALIDYDPDLKVKVASILAIPYPDGSLDGVLAVGTLEYVEDKVEQAVAEVKRVLKEGGVFFMEMPVISVLRRLVYIPLKRLEKLVRVWRGERPTFSYYLFDRNELKELLTRAGFEVTTVQPHELPEVDGHYGLYVDWPFLRGDRPYRLNTLGRLVKVVANAISPWVASTGVIVVARKRADV